MNASDVLESLSIETITQILTELGAEPVKETSEYIIFTSVCHGSNSHKLYLYKSSKVFKCWSHCGNMSLFDLIMRIKQCEFKDAFKYVKTFVTGGIHGFYKPYHKKSLEDVIIENRQALEMASIYGDILSRIMDAFSAIINNNQNNVMQLLTVVTLILSIPTMISGYFGMNVEGLPFSTDPNGFWIILFISTIICLILSILLSKNKLL